MSRVGADKLSTAEITYLINHVVLPPKLPQADDASAQNESSLIQTIISSLRDFKAHLDKQETQQVQNVLDAVSNLYKSRYTTGSISESSLKLLFSGLENGKTKGAIPLEIKAQNAGLIVSRQEESIVFEPFELSPSNGAVYETKGRLIRQFPAPASKLSLHTFREKGLQDTLTETITKMDSQPQPGFQPQAQKAGQMQAEFRDTTHPAIVTSFLGTVISALGETTDQPGIRKNTREEVLWSHSKEPWRRSPLWLLLRVTMQLEFSRSGLNQGMYKCFMVFHLSRLLRYAKIHHKELGSEILHVISSKISRRIKKIPNLSQPRWMLPVWEVLTSTHDLIDGKWREVMNGAQSHLDPYMLKELRPEDNLDVALPELTDFIQGIAARKQVDSVTEFQPVTVIRGFPAEELPSVPFTFGSDQENRHFVLMGVETWVQRHLQAWLGRHVQNEKASANLRQLILEYHRIASSAYTGLPESMSIMYLTIIELWVACDKSVCQVHTLLRQYDPEIPMELFQSLLLPLKEQMQRLSAVEVYIKSRSSSTNHNMPSLFHDFGHVSSFAVKFFDQSPSHQSLKLRIEQDATMKRDKKRRELSEKKQQHKTYMNEYELGTCEYTVVKTGPYDLEESVHVYNCKRCNWLGLAKQITIQVHEWPLSSDSSTAKATVFELMAPEAFANYREVTFFLLKTVSRCDFQHEQRLRNYTLGCDQALGPFLSWAVYNTQRIIPSSHTKANIKCHRGDQDHNTIPNLEEHNVCVNNGLQYQYFDQTGDVFFHGFSTTERMSQNCTFQLPSRSLPLQKFVYRPSAQPSGVPPNEVIASQFLCPSHMSLEEYKAFSSLPLGCKIQYMNILTQLAMPAVDFTKAETQCLIRQILHQAGYPSDHDTTERISHEELTNGVFGAKMIRQLGVSLLKVTENWESWRALASFVQLATRLLTLATSSMIMSRCLSYLVQARKVSMRWLDDIRTRIQTSTDNDQRSELWSRAVEVALVCTSTFDIDQGHVDKLLQKPSAASIFLQCSIVIQQSQDTTFSDHDSLYRTMLQSWRSLVYRVAPTLTMEIIARGNTCLSDAITATWSKFNPSSSWQALTGNKSHWLATTSNSEEKSAAPPLQM
jgi:hypothetical protein